MIGVVGHLGAALAWVALAVLLTARGRGAGIGRLLLGAVALQIVWALAMAASLTTLSIPHALIVATEATRPLAWSTFLVAMLGAGLPGRARGPLLLAYIAVPCIAAAHLAAPLLGWSPQLAFGGGLLAAVALLLCVELVYRNTPEHRRWSLKYLCLALGAMAVYDVVLYSDALLFGRFDFGWWAARGYAHALLVPLVAVTAARSPDWRLDIQVSRKVVFYSATLVASGAFLLAVSAIGYGLRFFGGAWAGVAQTLMMFGAVVAVVALIASGTLRARLRVLLAKHFFSYRYDYRSEWLKLTDLIARSDRAGTDGGTLSSRALQGLADLVESPGGALWLHDGDGGWRCEARQRCSPKEPIAADAPVLTFMAQRHWIVDLAEWRAEPQRYDHLELPEAVVSDPDAWLLVPLLLQDSLVGVVLLHRPAAPVKLDWEVRDVLKTAGKQVAGYLAVRQAVEKLVQARQFDSFNRMSAFVVHDLKNLVAQLHLLLRNAARHRDNPEFQADMLETVENVLDRMQGLLMQLRVGTRPIEQPTPLAVGSALRAAIVAKRGLRVEPVLDIAADAELAQIVAHRDRFERVIGHLVQNAVEATPAGGRVRVTARRDGPDAVIEVIDTGRGMSREFLETQLFKPFTSTKEHGMGIGAFESRDYVREIGGALGVVSAEGRGTTFTLRLPLHASSTIAERNL